MIWQPPMHRVTDLHESAPTRVTMENWLSGLELTSCLEFLGKDCIDDTKSVWRTADETLEALGKDEQSVPRRVFWFYRSPARLSAPADVGLGDLLRQWVEVTRSVLHFRRKIGRVSCRERVCKYV